MSSNFLTTLSQDLSTLLNKGDFYDTIIEVGNELTDQKVFQAHSVILYGRCEFFKVALSQQWARKIKDKFLINLRNMNFSSNAFELILKYIYSGRISLGKHDNIFMLIELLIASDVLLLQELFDYVKSQLFEKKSQWNNEDLIRILSISYQISNAKDLYSLCQDIVDDDPLIFFESSEFKTINEELLLHVLKLNIIGMPEIIIFNKLIQWGMKNTPGLDNLTEPFNLSHNKLKELGKTIRKGIRLIRYRNMTKEDLDKISFTFKSILPRKEILIKTPRINKSFEPNILSSKFAGLIASWIDRKSYTGFKMPFKFEKVYEFEKSFNSSLPNINYHYGPSLMIMKIQETGQFLGAYNPIDWSKYKLPTYDPIMKTMITKKAKRDYKEFSRALMNFIPTSESFLFSSDDKYGTNFKLSRVKNVEQAIRRYELDGHLLLKFGSGDLFFEYDKGQEDWSDGNGYYYREYIPASVTCIIKSQCYEPAVLPNGWYKLETWEIYRVVRKTNN
ncbi:kelch-like protein 17 [Gigaspora margarita]|uniref:Kelch-like protein 17 n=1 Tax=Gigaspora margarita TaxID=4874 RepID=A0A8H3X9X9_GIGMA|nr:kelch-like protein 17 [Gigaspora margarita]